jgi:hypothetical protein
MPVRSWASTLASFHVRRSYNCRVCLPGSAASTRFTCLPIFSGSLLLGTAWDCAIFNVIDFILETCSCGRASSCVTVLAYSLARPNSLLSSVVGI